MSSQVGVELFDSQGRQIGMDGCPVTAAGYATLAHTNLKSPCCYLLPAAGSADPTYEGRTLSHAWKVTGLPANAATAWIEVYPKKCCVPAGTTNTDDSRYGRALRRPIPLSATGVDVRLPLRCGQSGGGVSGRAGAISGKVYDNGKLVSSNRVGARSQEPDTEAKILGWGLHGNGAGSYHVQVLAPGTYSVIATANGTSRHIYGVQVAACQTTILDVAVRGTVPAAGKPVSGDWDGDGDDEPGSFRTGTWQLRDGVGSTGVVAHTFSYGVQAGDVPVVGDWDGDGVDDAGIFRRGTWHLRSSQTGQTIRTVTYGVQAGDVPVVGDWDGDAVDDLGIYRRGGSWHLRRSSNGTTMPVITYGVQAGDVPVVGDWDADGDDEPGIFRRGGVWHLRMSTSSSAGTRPTFTYGTQVQDRPLTGDWSGSGSSAVAIFRSGTWHLRSSSTPSGSTFVTFPFGS